MDHIEPLNTDELLDLVIRLVAEGREQQATIDSQARFINALLTDLDSKSEECLQLAREKEALVLQLNRLLNGMLQQN